MKNKKKKHIALLLVIVMLLSVGVLGATSAFAADADDNAASTVTDTDDGTETDTDDGVSTVAASEICSTCGTATSNGFCTASGCGGYMACEKNGNGYYEIGNGGQLFWFASLVNSGSISVNGALTADINLESRTWTPIGRNNRDRIYYGTFDGQGHIITNVYVNAPSANSPQGLFGTVSGTVKNLGTITGSISGYQDVGAIVGLFKSGTIENCFSIYSISVSGTYYVGGIVGNMYGGSIKNCYSYANLKVGSYGVGLIYGKASGGTVSNCYYYNALTNAPDGSPASASVTAKTADQITNGEVTWLLNGSSTVGAKNGVWKQTIGTDYPHFTGERVYTQYCNGNTSNGYYNTLTHTSSASYDANGFCANGCGAYQPAVKNSSGYYQIRNAGQLLWFAGLVNGTLTNVTQNTSANAVLMNNIDLTGLTVWKYMDTYYGTFDGQGYSIIGMNTDAEGNRCVADEQAQGFIRYLRGTVKNVTFDSAWVDTQSSQGNGIIAYNNYGTISKCMVENSYATLGNYGGLGLIAGKNMSGGVIEYCGAVNSVLARRYGGSSSKTMGFIAEENAGTIRHCFSYGCKFQSGTSANGALISSGNAPTNSYYYTTSTTVSTYGTAKSVEAFESGEVAYLLNNQSSSGVWKQTVGTSADAYPSLAGKTVYTYYLCYGEQVYTNDSSLSGTTLSHSFNSNGFCTNEGCGGYQPAVYNNSTGFYEISNGGQLFWFAQQVNAGNSSYKGQLTADIDLEGDQGRVWIPIGTVNYRFSSTFDGDYHRIKNMRTNENDKNQGLFGVVSGTVTVREVIIDASCIIKGTQYVAGIVAATSEFYSTTLTIESCANFADVTAYSTDTAEGNNSAGIYGVNMSSLATVTIRNCLNAGDISGSKEGESGAISGWLGSKFTVESCLNLGTVDGVESGRHFARYDTSGTGKFTNCYDAANMTQSGITHVTAEQLASGEIAWRLNNSTSTGVWKQTLGASGAAYPSFAGETVYEYHICAKAYYTNDVSISGVTYHVHVDDEDNKGAVSSLGSSIKLSCVCGAEYVTYVFSYDGEWDKKYLYDGITDHRGHISFTVIGELSSAPDADEIELVYTYSEDKGVYGATDDYTQVGWYKATATIDGATATSSEIGVFMPVGVLHEGGLFQGYGSTATAVYMNGTLPANWQTLTPVRTGYTISNASFNTSKMEVFVPLEIYQTADGALYIVSSTYAAGYITSISEDGTVGLFENFTKAVTIDITKLDTNSMDGLDLLNLEAMFAGCSVLERVTFGDRFLTAQADGREVNMAEMFLGCSALTTLELHESFNTVGVTDMSYMFSGCDGLKEGLQALLARLDTSKVQSMAYMFQNLGSIDFLDLSGLNTSSLQNASGIFAQTQIKTINLTAELAARLDATELAVLADGWIHEDGSHYADNTAIAADAKAGLYTTHSHEGDGYRYAAEGQTIEIYCACGTLVKTYTIEVPVDTSADGQGGVVYEGKYTETIIHSAYNFSDPKPTFTFYRLNDAGEYVPVESVIEAGKYKMEMTLGAATRSFGNAGLTASATAYFEIDIKRDFELGGSIDVSTPNYTTSTMLGNKPVIILDAAGKVTVITNYEIVVNTGVNALLLVPEFAENFRIVGISVNGTLLERDGFVNASSNRVLVDGWSVIFTGAEDTSYTGSFKIELEKEQGGSYGIDESVTGELFIQIVYESTEDIDANERFTFGFDLDESQAWSSVYEDGSVAEDRKVTISVTDAVVDVIIRETGEITFAPDQSLEYDGENIAEIEGTGKTPEELAALLKEYIVYYYNGFTFRLHENLAAELAEASVVIDWSDYIDVVWYDAEGNPLAEAPKNAGTYKIVITATANEFLTEATAELTFRITPYVFDATVSANPNEKPYNGSEQTWGSDELVHSAIDRLDGYLKVDEEKYTITGIVGTWINAGNYKLEVTLTAKDNYTFDGSKTKTFEVDVAITRLTITITADDQTGEYSDAIKDLTWFVNEKDATLLEMIKASIASGNLTVDITTTATSESDAGTYVITITVTDHWAANGNSNYEGVSGVNGTYTITRKVVQKPVLDKELTYNGTEQGYDYLAAWLVNNKEAFTLTGNQYINAGDYELTATLVNINNYVWAEFNHTNQDGTVSITLPWSIEKADITIDFLEIADGHTSEYLEVLAAIRQAITGTIFDDLGTADVETLNHIVTVTIGDKAIGEINLADLIAGTYTVSATATEFGTTNYNISITDGTYEVTKRILGDNAQEIISMIIGVIKEYTGKEVTWENGDFTVKDWAYAVDWTKVLSITEAEKLAEYINANGKGTESATWEYYDEAIKYFYTVTITLLDTDNFVLYMDNGTEVGKIEGAQAEVLIRQAANSFVSGPTVNHTGDLAILDTTFDVLFGDDTQDDKDKITIKYFDKLTNTEVAWADLVADKEYYVVVSVPENPNWAAIEGQSNFTTTIGAVLIPVIRVDSDTGNIVLIGQRGEVIYDGAAHSLVVIPAGQGRYTVTLSREGDWINAGTYTITVTIDPNYKWQSNSEEGDTYGDDKYNETTDTFEYTLVIKRKAITITANDKNINYNEDAPGYDVTVETLAGSETLAGLGLDITAFLECLYAKGDDAGIYDINFTETAKVEIEAIITNYEVTLVKGELNVAKLTISLEALTGQLDEETAKLWAELVAGSDLKVTYDSETHTITVSGYDEEKLEIKVLYNGSEEKPENAGTYTVTLDIKIKDEFAPNYKIEGAGEDGTVDVGSVVLVIDPLELHVTILNHTHSFNFAYVTLPEELKAIIKHTDGTVATEAFIAEEVMINLILNRDNYVWVKADGSAYEDAITVEAFDDKNYLVKYYNESGEETTSADLTIVYEWGETGKNDKDYDGLETVYGTVNGEGVQIWGTLANWDEIIENAKIFDYTNAYTENGQKISKVEFLNDGPFITSGPIDAGIYAITIRIEFVVTYADGSTTSVAIPATEATVENYEIRKIDLGVSVGDVNTNYLVNYRPLITITPNGMVTGETFVPVYKIVIVDKDGNEYDVTELEAADILSAGFREVGDYTIKVTVTNLANANYTATDATADLTIEQATLAAVEFIYNKNNASWEAIGKTTDNEDINKYGDVTVVYAVTGPNSFNVTLDEGVLTFDAPAVGSYTMTASVAGDDKSFAPSVNNTVAVVSVTFADGEHDKNETNLDRFVAAWAPEQLLFVGQVAERPDDTGAPTLEGYDFMGWELDGAAYTFTEGVTGSIEVTINWDIKTFTMTWIGADGETIHTSSVTYLGELVYDGTTPTKDSDREWHYTYGGWHGAECAPVDTAIDLTEVEVRGDMTFYVHFDVKGVSYKVIFHVWNEKEQKYEIKKTVEEIEFGAELSELYALTPVTWFINDVWYTDEARWGERHTTVPSTEEGELYEINLYGAYKFDIGTGDVNADGRVNADDITLFRKWIVGGYIMTVVDCKTIADIWEYVQTEEFNADDTHFIVYVADTNNDSASDIRDVTTIRMALVGGYGYMIETGVDVSGEEVMVDIYGSSAGIDYNVQLEENMTVEKSGDRETVRISDDTITGIKVKLSSVPENYDASGFWFVANQHSASGETDYIEASDVTVEYMTTEDGSTAYITILGLDWSITDVYIVSFDMDGTDSYEYFEHHCTIVYEAETVTE